MTDSDAEWRHEVERRLAALERSPQLTNASIRDGRLQVLDADGFVRVEIGKLFTDFNGDGQPDWGVAVWTPEGRANFALSEHGYFHPWLITPLAPYDPTLFSTVSAVYDTVGRVDFNCTSSHWSFDVFALPEAATTMDFRFVAAIQGDPPLPVYEQTGITVATQFASDLDLLADLAADVIGQDVTIRLEARVTAGPGAARVRFNTPPVNRLVV